MLESHPRCVTLALSQQAGRLSLHEAKWSRPMGASTAGFAVS